MSSTRGKTPIGIASYPHVFQPQAGKPNQPAKYSITLLLDKNDPGLEDMKACYRAAVEEKWGSKKPSGLRSPFRDGDEKDDDGNRKRGPEYAGKVYITFRSPVDRKPGVVDGALNPVTQESGKLYAGAMVRISFGAYGYDNDGNRGVSFGLNNIQVVRSDTPRLDSRTDAEDDFDAVEDKSAAAMF